MELLIPGLILVGLMVYASTKIKKKAAAAFESEAVETAEFSITKPDGFICPVDHAKELLFAAYSKEFGSGETGGIRRASAEIRAFEDVHFDDIRDRIKADSTRVAAEDIGVLNDSRSSLIETEEVMNGTTFARFFKILGGEKKVFELAITILPEFKSEYEQRTDIMLSSFILK